VSKAELAFGRVVADIFFRAGFALAERKTGTEGMKYTWLPSTPSSTRGRLKATWRDNL
jgi:hypothetical protein